MNILLQSYCFKCSILIIHKQNILEINPFILKPKQINLKLEYIYILVNVLN